MYVYIYIIITEKESMIDVLEVERVCPHHVTVEKPPFRLH